VAIRTYFFHLRECEKDLVCMVLQQTQLHRACVPHKLDDCQKYNVL
jgi:hypothetical protein